MVSLSTCTLFRSSRTMEPCEDAGVFYTYEHGKLNLSSKSSSHSRYHQNKTSPNHPKRLRTQRQKTTVESNPKKVESLRATCISFVAKNISLVDSLVGFPDIVGVEIFEAVKLSGHVDDWTSPGTHSTLGLFVESYGGLVLESLARLPRGLLDECGELVTCFSALRRLDLSNLRLGDGHTLWQWVANLGTLTDLRARNCCLTDRGLQHLTMAARMYDRGPTGLEELDLACNPGLTDGCVRYLCCFYQLRSLTLSGTSITASGISRLEKSSILRQTPEPPTGRPPSASPPIEHSGWAGDVVSGWVREYRDTAHQLPTEDAANTTSDVLKAKHFYKKCKPRRRDTSDISDLLEQPPCPPEDPYIKLVSLTTEPQTCHDASSLDYMLADAPTRLVADTNSTAVNLKKRTAAKKKTQSLKNIVDECLTRSAEEFSSSDRPMIGDKLAKGASLIDNEDVDLLREYSESLKKDKSKSLWAAMNSDSW